MSELSSGLQELLRETLLDSDSRGAWARLVKQLEAVEDGRAAPIRKWLDIDFNGTPVSEVVADLLPKRIGVEFAASCAEHVLHVFTGYFPSDDRPALVLRAIGSWIRGDSTAKSVERVNRELGRFQTEEERWWSLNDVPDEASRIARARAGFAADSAFFAGCAVGTPASSHALSRWVREVAHKAVLAIDYPSALTEKSSSSGAEQRWQILRLAQLLEASKSSE